MTNTATKLAVFAAAALAHHVGAQDTSATWNTREVDCNGNTYFGYELWVADGWCDNGIVDYGGVNPNFMCEAFNFDGGDCGDCDGNPYDGFESRIGDGYCDPGPDGKVLEGDMMFVSDFNFDCEAFDYDAGDCEESMLDCDGNSYAGFESKLGDDFCDAGPDGKVLGGDMVFVSDFNFDCEKFNFDNEDCSQDCYGQWTDYECSSCDGHATRTFVQFFPATGNGQGCETQSNEVETDRSRPCMCDCQDQPLFADVMQSHLGDGTCDESLPITTSTLSWFGSVQSVITVYDLNCESLDFDGGDCRDFLDCDGKDYAKYALWIGDGWCDNGVIDYGMGGAEPNFYCEAFEFDGGDCDSRRLRGTNNNPRKGVHRVARHH